MATKTKKSTEWISVKAAARIIKVTPCRVRQLIAAGRIRCFANPHYDRAWLVDKADARRYRDSPRKSGRPRAEN